MSVLEAITTIEGNGVNGVKVVFFLGGDLAWLHEFLGLSGCSLNNPCVWCPVKKEVLASHDQCSLRSLADMAQMSHHVLEGCTQYTCPKCPGKELSWENR